MIVKGCLRNFLSYDDPTPEELAEMAGEVDPGGGAPGGGEPPPQAQPEWQAPEFVMLGEEQVPWDKAVTWMNGGRNYSQRAAELNRTIEDKVSEAQAAHQAELAKFQRYNEINQYAEENPEWWQHVTQAYEGRATHGLDPNLQQAIQQVVTPLQEKLNQVTTFAETLQQERVHAERTQNDQALDQRIKDVRDKFPTIDFDTPDPQTGTSLETKVLQHMQESGIYDFRAAFLDLNFDRLPDFFKSQDATRQASQVEAQRKAGVTAVTPVPAKQNDDLYRFKGSSWDEDAEQLKQELGLTS